MPKRFRRWYEDTVPASGLAVFRILYCLVLFAEVFELYRFRHLVFDLMPHLQPYEVSFDPLLIAWLVAILTLGFGFKTRVVAIANYCFTLVTFSAFSAFEYHVDYVYTAANLLLIFSPVSNRLSVDAVLAARAGRPLPPRVGRVYRDAVLFCCIGLVYFDSVLFKLSSSMWRAGLGLWLPASYPHSTWYDVTSLLDNRGLMLALGYGTILFEGLFLLLMWSRRLQPLLLVCGMALHVGIVAVFPIPWFGLAVAAMYVLLLPDRVLDTLFSAGKPLHESATATSEPNRRRIVLAVMMLSLLLQLPSILTAPATVLLARNTPFESLHRKIAKNVAPYVKLGRPFLGTTPHPVFMDFHFNGYDHEFAIIYHSPDGKEIWLPVIDEHGRTDRYNTGRFWVNWTFRVVSPQIDSNLVRRGMTRMTAFWAGENGIELKDAKFRIVARSYDRPVRWEPGFGERQSQKPWIDAGSLTWSGGRATFEFQNPDAPQAVSMMQTSAD